MKNYVVSILFVDVLTGINNFYMRDLTRYYYPAKQILREIVYRGEFPYWNPYFSAGQPIAANPEHEVFYPLTWLILLPSYDFGFRLHILIHIYIGVLGTISISAANSCGAALTSFSLGVGTAANVIATATTTTSVNVTWTSPAGSYEVARVSSAGSVTLGQSVTGAWIDNTASAGTAYLYKVRAATGGTPPYSDPDLATTVIFTDPILTAGSNVIRAVHMTELRTAVDAVRLLAALPLAAFTDPAPAGVLIKRIHVIELRTALDSARALLALRTITYTTPAIVAGSTPIMKAHVDDLRNGVR